MTRKTIVLEIATKYGLQGALVMQHVFGWVKFNEKNGNNYKDGKYWMYQTIKDMSQELQCMSPKQVGDTLRKLVKEGIICKGNYNKLHIDKTGWYTFTARGWELMEQYGSTDNTSKYKACYETAQAIPNNTNNIENKDNVVVVSGDNMGENGNNEIEYYEQYPVPKQELDKVKQLLANIWKKYYPANVSFVRNDVQNAIEYVVSRKELEDGTAIAVYDSTKAELLLLAFDIAHKSGRVTWKYVEGIYSNWDELAIKTINDYHYHEGLRKLNMSM